VTAFNIIIPKDYETFGPFVSTKAWSRFMNRTTGPVGKNLLDLTS
jgi:hypothetical protein